MMGLAGLALLLAPTYAIGQGQAQATGETAATSAFHMTGRYSVPESYPFGPGDRSATIKVKLLPGETTKNIEYWVLYSDDRPLLTGAHVGSEFPHGQAVLQGNDVTGDITAQFIFPHKDHPTPNLKDVEPREFRSGAKVYYKWVKKNGSTSIDSPIVEFTLPDKLTIVNMGDSYAAGEGAPHKSGDKWDDEPAHRSNNSGQVLAVRALKARAPGTAVAFLNVASSGAGVTEGILQSQKRKGFLQSELHSTPIKPQIEQVRDRLKKNSYDTVNVVLLSIGINEIGFATTVADYFIGPRNLANDKIARQNIDTDVKELKQDYAALKGAFDKAFDYQHVIVSEYPNPTQWENGDLCGKELPVRYGLCWGPLEVTSGEAEYKLARDIGVAMNNTIKTAVQAFSDTRWKYGEGAMDASKDHGMCNCEDPWFNTIGASMLVQGDFHGTWHPNRVGHAEFVKPLIGRQLQKVRLSIGAQYAKERAREIAIEEAKRKSKAKALLAARLESVSATPRRSALPDSSLITPEILQKARESAMKLPALPAGEDNGATDDYERSN